MSAEADFIGALRELATAPGARNLMDDAAVLEIGGRILVLTKDMLVEGVHYLAADPAEEVAWKLVAVNLSDLAAKAARPVGALLGYSLADRAWDLAFVRGLGAALDMFGVKLLGGDTVATPAGAPRTLSLTLIGEATGAVPSRSGARAGDQLWVSGSIGDAGLGLAMLQGDMEPDEMLVRRYRTPTPRLEAGQALGSMVHAMMDASDGLLIDAARMAEASGLRVHIELPSVPLSGAFVRAVGEGREARIRAATAGDDYELLFAAPGDRAAVLTGLSKRLDVPLSRIGTFEVGGGLILSERGAPLELPERLGWEHEASLSQAVASGRASP